MPFTKNKVKSAAAGRGGELKCYIQTDIQTDEAGPRGAFAPNKVVTAAWGCSICTEITNIHQKKMWKQRFEKIINIIVRQCFGCNLITHAFWGSWILQIENICFDANAKKLTLLTLLITLASGLH